MNFVDLNGGDQFIKLMTHKEKKKKKVKKIKAISFNASPVVYDESLPKGILDQKIINKYLLDEKYRKISRAIKTGVWETEKF